MAAGETFPKISRKIWWLLRDRLKKTVPSAITPTIISSLSEMTEASAKANVIAPLRQLGLIDENNKPTDLAERWRHDDEYTKVCHAIRQKTYPQELVEAFPEVNDNQRGTVKNWFMKIGQVGEGAAGKFADTYVLLSEADPNQANEKAPSDSSVKAKPRVAKPKPVKATPVEPQSEVQTAQAQSQPVAAEPAPHSSRRIPAIHIDVQVHISPDTPADQIDRIFESMAKHLGGYIK